MKKFIEVNGEKMNAVEFTRFIRTTSTPKINKIIKQTLEKQHKNNLKLKRLQESD